MRTRILVLLAVPVSYAWFSVTMPLLYAVTLVAGALTCLEFVFEQHRDGTAPRLLEVRAEWPPHGMLPLAALRPRPGEDIEGVHAIPVRWLREPDQEPPSLSDRGLGAQTGISLDVLPELYAHVTDWMRPLFDSSLTLSTVVAVVLNQLLRINWSGGKTAGRPEARADVEAAIEG